MGDLVVADKPTTPAQRHPGGRPTLYSNDVAETICQFIKDGAPEQDAALAAGLTKETFYAWKRAKAEFSDRLSRAYAECNARMAQVVTSIATGDAKVGDWRPAIEYLKRRDRANWGDVLDIRKLDTVQLMEMIQGQLLGVEVHDTDDTAEVLADDVL